MPPDAHETRAAHQQGVSSEDTPLRTAVDVVTMLRLRMNDIVRDYDDGDPDGVQRVCEPIDGTAFFPGGHGLWRGTKPHGPLPEFFPNAPVMFVGHNFDSVRGYRRSQERGIELVRNTTWVKLLQCIAAAGLRPEECFFTNALMGLQPKASVGTLKTTERFRAECRQFLSEQVRIVRPRAIAALGPVAAQDLERLKTRVPVIALKHPYATIRLPDLAETEGARLRNLLEAPR